MKLCAAVVVSVGARTPIGLDAKSTGFSHRAATVAMQLSPLLDAKDEPATMCFLPTLDPFSTGVPRAVQLAGPALVEALGPLRPYLPHLRLKLVLCLDEHLGARDRGGFVPASDLAGELTRKAAALAPKLEDVATAARGAAALGFTLERLLDELSGGKVDAAVIGGVHSDYDPARIRALSEAKRLLSPDQLDSLIPGECAAFAVLMRPDRARACQLRRQVELHSFGTGYEKARPDNDEPAFTALGLTAAVRQAAKPLLDEQQRAGWLLTDLSFETMRLYELQAVMARTQKLWCEPQLCDSPAQRIGYLGAAAMPLHLVLAAEGWRRGWAPHPIAISIAGSDSGERSALLMSAPGPE